MVCRIYFETKIHMFSTYGHSTAYLQVAIGSQYRIARNFGGQNFGGFAKNRFWRLIFWRIDAKADIHAHVRISDFGC